MNNVLLQARLSTIETQHLIAEFPQLIFLPFTENSYKQLPPETWFQIEILFGNRLTKAELGMAEHLRWIHSPTPDLSQLCLKDIQARGNIVITTSTEENASQIAEFAFAGILAFAKNLFEWMDIDKSPLTVWGSQLRNEMQTLKGKSFLQIGLGTVGSEIAKQAKEAKMEVWGIHEQSSFHPSCSQTFQKNDLSQLLPKADVISFTPSPSLSGLSLKKDDFEKMKQGCILFIRGSNHVLDEKALYEVAQTGKFRGIIFDVHYKTALAGTSPLWKIPRILITPDVGPRPKSIKVQAARTFRFNLRQYLHGNFQDMKNTYEHIT